MRLRKRLFLLTMLLIFNVSFCHIIPCYSASESCDSCLDEKSIAKVNDTFIAFSSLAAITNAIMKTKEMRGVIVTAKEKHALEKEMLERLITKELLYQESQKVIKEDLIPQIYAEIENIKKGYASEEAFNKMLTDSHMTILEFKKAVRKEAYVNKLLNTHIYNKIMVSESDKKTAYDNTAIDLSPLDSVNLSIIFIKIPGNASMEERNKAKAKADSLRTRILQGEDFAKLAMDNSDDPSALKGGNMGYYKKDSFIIKPVDDIAFTLEKGGISNIIETLRGFYIIKILDKKTVRDFTYEETSNTIEQCLLNQKRKEAAGNFIDIVKKTAKIEIYSDALPQ
jgi:peptidyl-prolyl cis-trans isomerase C